MMQDSLSHIIADQTRRALWEVRNVIACVPEELWTRPYCEAPLWQHMYHMLHSLDVWYQNPRDPAYTEPDFHTDQLNNLDVRPDITLTRAQLEAYFEEVSEKIEAYTASLTDEVLLEKPENCEYARFTCILAQFRHLHTHLGMLMGFLIGDTGEWPFVLGLERSIPDGGFGTFF